MAGADLMAVFERLRAVMAPAAEELDVTDDAPGNLTVRTRHMRADGYVFAFGAVQVKSRYVSYHLVPVYAFPDLLDGVSDDLRRRMQGKSCFNFSRIDEPLFDELAGLTARALDRVRDQSPFDPS